MNGSSPVTNGSYSRHSPVSTCITISCSGTCALIKASGSAIIFIFWMRHELLSL